MKTLFLLFKNSRFLLPFIFVIITTNLLLAQTNGDFRSVTTGDWTTPGCWQMYDGSTWKTATYYPGDLSLDDKNCTNYGHYAVTIQSGHTISLPSSNFTTSDMGTLTINGTLNLPGDNSGKPKATLNSLEVIVSTGGTINYSGQATLNLPAGAVLVVGTGGLSGKCSNNNELDIGGIKYAVCTGGGNAPYTFADIMANGGNSIRYFVTSTGSDGASGTSWTTPFKTIQHALDMCTSSTKRYEIWVAKGTYTPSKDAAGNATTGATSTFSLQRNVSIYGGFVGNAGTETPSASLDATTILNRRDFKTNTTTLSGNNTSISVVSYYAWDSNWDNATLDGVTINGCVSGSTTITSKNLALNQPETVSSTESGLYPGNNAVDGNLSTRWASSWFESQATIYVDLGSIQSINRFKITWENAYAVNYTIDVSNNASSWSTIQTINGNSSTNNDNTVSTTNARYVRISCLQKRNFGTSLIPFYYGFSIYELEVYSSLTNTNYAANIPTGATIQNCKIISNSGNGLNLSDGATAYNILIAKNGIGVNLAGDGSKLINATIVNNTGVAINAASASATVTNSILWNNTGGNLSGSIPNITYSAATSNYAPGYASNVWSTGLGNLELYQRTPNFKDAANDNYELWLISPCLEKGLASANSIAIDANGNQRTHGGIIDMGAYQKIDGYVATGGKNMTAYRGSATTSAAFSSTSNQELKVPAGVTLDMDSKTFNVSRLEVTDDNTTAPAILNGTLKANAAYYVRKCTKFRNDNKGASTFFSLPFATSALNSTGTIEGGIIESTIRIIKYDENTRATNGTNKSAWMAMTNEPISIGKGYAITFHSSVPDQPLATTIIFASNGSVSLGNTASPTTLSFTSGYPLNDSGWNLIGNPFAQAANINTSSSGNWPYSDNSLTNLAGGIYIYNSASDTYRVTPLELLNSAGLSPYGAYFIKTKSINPNQVQLSTAPSGSVPMRAKSTVSAISAITMNELSISNGSISSNAYLFFADNAHAEMIDIEDSPNLTTVSNGTNIVMNTFATGSTIGLGINSLPFVGNTLDIPLQVIVPKADSYTLSLPEGDTNTTTTLIEADGTTHDLTSSSYAFSTNSASTLNYTLHFERQNVSTGQSTTLNQESGITIYQENGKAVVTSIDPLLQVKLYDINGQLIHAVNNGSTRTLLDLPAAGVYLVKATTAEKTATKKLVYK